MTIFSGGTFGPPPPELPPNPDSPLFFPPIPSSVPPIVAALPVSPSLSLLLLVPDDPPFPVLEDPPTADVPPLVPVFVVVDDEALPVLALFPPVPVTPPCDGFGLAQGLLRSSVFLPDKPSVFEDGTPVDFVPFSWRGAEPRLPLALVFDFPDELDVEDPAPLPADAPEVEEDVSFTLLPLPTPPRPPSGSVSFRFLRFVSSSFVVPLSSAPSFSSANARFGTPEADDDEDDMPLALVPPVDPPVLERSIPALLLLLVFPLLVGALPVA